jgi:hypothetical protein
MRKQISYLSIAQVKTWVEKLRTDSKQICKTFILSSCNTQQSGVYLFFFLVLGERGIGEEKRVAERDAMFTYARTGWELIICSGSTRLREGEECGYNFCIE